MFPDIGILPEELSASAARQAIPVQLLLCLTKSKTVNTDLLHHKYAFVSLTARV